MASLCAFPVLRVLLLLALGSPHVQAQSDSDTVQTPRQWRTGGALMFPMGQQVDPTFAALSFTATTARPLRLGPDIALAVVPRGLMYGAILGGARLNLGVPIPVSSNVTIVPSAGLTLAGAIAVLGVAGGRGANGTLAIHLLNTPRSGPPATHGLRVALTQHVFAGNGSVRMFEIGFLRR